MPYKISGGNDFHEGWLARVLDKPKSDSKSETWQIGWDTANETSPEACDRYGFQVFKKMIEIKQLIVEEVD